MESKAIYLTDDRDLPDEDQRSLVIFQGGNGDWYVQVAPKHGRTMDGVRLCTSGGASTKCPGLTVAIAEAYRAIKASESGERSHRESYQSLLDEVTAWREQFPSKRFDGLGITTGE